MNRQYSQNYHKASKPLQRRILPLVGFLGGLCAIMAVVALAGYAVLIPAEAASTSLVLINSPLNRDQIEIDQRVIVQAVARDESGLTRVELWVNGQLYKTETSSLPGGLSPFPLVTTWQPRVSGTYTLIVRAFNTSGDRTQASVEISVPELLDRDDDAVADEIDICPDQPGTTITAGCPDTDSDGVADLEDSCPGETGMPESGGCPLVTESDRDGDGTPDASDACPDELGPRPADGCPDADTDGIADREDACPAEAGWEDHAGCPTVGDRDGDGFLDADDTCPDDYGVEATWGCPDGDGDGVRDSEDMCPAEPGPPENDGCAVMRSDGAVLPGSDSDHDGAPDDSDPCPLEPGTPEDGYCPPAAGEEPPAPSRVLELPDYFFSDFQIPVWLEIQALELEVSGDYAAMECYAGVIGRFYDRYGPFESLGERRWDIAEYLGNGAYGIPPMATYLDDIIQVEVHCNANFGSSPINLGRYVGEHTGPWDGHVITGESWLGDDDHSFQVKYRLCSPSCDESAYSAPFVHTLYNWAGEPNIAWAWDGNEDLIRGFKIYLNGNFVLGVGKEARSAALPFSPPSCGERWDIQVSAWDGVDARAPERESALSNVVTKEGEPCHRMARVTFETINAYDLPDDTEMDSSLGMVGPVSGSLIVNDDYEMFDTSFRDFIGDNYGVFLIDHHDYSVLGRLGSGCQDRVEAVLSGASWRDIVRCLETDIIEVPLDPEDNLTIRAFIFETDPSGAWSILFDGSMTLPAPPEGATGGQYTLRDSRGYLDLIVRVEILPSDH